MWYRGLWLQSWLLARALSPENGKLSLVRRETPLTANQLRLASPVYAESDDEHQHTQFADEFKNVLREIANKQRELTDRRAGNDAGVLDVRAQRRRRNHIRVQGHLTSRCNWSDGLWVASRTSAAHYSMHQFLVNANCSDCHAYGCPFAVQQKRTWRWQPVNSEPQGCSAWSSLLDVNGTEEFCRRVPGNILIVGCSVSHQMTLSLAASLNATLASHPGDKDEPAEPFNKQSWTICGERQIKLRFVRSDHLSLNNASINRSCSSDCQPLDATALKHNPVCVPWKPLLKDTSVLVLNSGNHHLASALFSQAMCEAAADVFGGAGCQCGKSSINASQGSALMRSLGARHETIFERINKHITEYANLVTSALPPGAIAFWRNNAPGHANCAQLDEPFSSFEEAQRFVNAEPWYDGETVESVNKIASEIFERAGFRIIDAYTPTLLRKDRHMSWSKKGNRDCLHYCIPGPIDHWNELLFNLL